MEVQHENFYNNFKHEFSDGDPFIEKNKCEQLSEFTNRKHYNPKDFQKQILDEFDKYKHYLLFQLK